MRMVVVRGRRTKRNNKKNHQMYHLQRNNSFIKNTEQLVYIENADHTCNLHINITVS